MFDIGEDEGPHNEAEALLPWYVTGRLDEPDRQMVEAHLQVCAQCQRQLFTERRLIDEFRLLTPQADSAWGRLRARIETQVPARQRTLRRAALDAWGALTRSPRMVAFAAQALFVVAAGSLLLSLDRPIAPTFHSLGMEPDSSAANLLVIFRPDTTDADIRDVLKRSHASLVGGPTSAQAYLLHVQGARRQALLIALSSDQHVKVAQPIDGPASP